MENFAGKNIILTFAAPIEKLGEIINSLKTKKCTQL
jgi:hypothetical protein